MEPQQTPHSAPRGALPPIEGWLPAPDEEEWSEDAADPAPEPRKARLRMALLLLVTLAVGAAAGSLATRQRYKGRQVVASINGVLITEPDFLHRMEITTGDNTLRQMVTEQLQLQYARQRGVFPAEADVLARYKKLSEQPSFGQYLAATHQGPEDVMQGLRVSLAREAVVTRGETVTDAEVRAYYDRQTDPRNPRARYYTPRSVTLAVIKTRSRQQVDLAASELAQGAAFDKVAARYSQDASRQRGGVLPPVPFGRTPSSRVSGAEAIVFALQVGEQTGPRQIAGDWWIIRCLDKKPAVIKPFAEVVDECRENALLEKSLPARSEAVHESYQKFSKDANIRAFWPQYKYVIGGR
jgi:foldase protein PrsA